jgi:hypothetical protein
MTVFEKIESQQGKVQDAVWMVGEQLKDICRSDPHCAEIVMQDLENPDMSLAKCEKKIKAYADKHKTGNFSCVIPSVADKLIRDFYGLPAAGAPAPVVAKQEDKPAVIDIADLF